MRHLAPFTLLATALISAELQSQRARPDVLAPVARDTAAIRQRSAQRAVEVPEVTMWSPSRDRFDQSDFATVYFNVDRDAFVAAFEVGTDGRVRILYPRSPRDPMFMPAGSMRRVLAGGGFYPSGPGATQIPYVFVLASSEPFDLTEFGKGTRWRYQLASGGRSKYPAVTIRHVTSLLFGNRSDPLVGADYIYFATREQVRLANALRALDGCGGLSWGSMSFSDIGSDFFFDNIFVPMWDLYLPFTSFYSGFLMRGSPGCSRITPFAPITFAGGRGLPTITPTTSAPPAPSTGPRAAPERRSPVADRRDRRKAEGGEDKSAVRVAGVSPVRITDRATEEAIVPERLRERRDREYMREKLADVRRERSASSPGSYGRERSSPSPVAASSGSSGSSSGRAASAPPPPRAEAPPPKADAPARESGGSRTAKDP